MRAFRSTSQRIMREETETLNGLVVHRTFDDEGQLHSFPTDDGDLGEALCVSDLHDNIIYQLWCEHGRITQENHLVAGVPARRTLYPEGGEPVVLRL